MRTIQAVQTIDAAVDEVWGVLVDNRAYGRWNPFITALEGDLLPGAELVVRIAPPGGKAMTFRPTVTHVDGEHRLEWLGRLGVPGIFDGRHQFLLRQLPDGRTELTQREEFSGLLVPLMRALLAKTEQGFRAMNEALTREVAERRGRGVEA